jgi:hypothetical protein
MSMKSKIIFFCMILLSFFLVPHAQAFLPSCNSTDTCEIGIKDLSQSPAYKKEYVVTEFVNTDPERDKREKELTRTYICLEEGYRLKSSGSTQERIITHKEKESLEAVFQEFSRHLDKIPNIIKSHYSIHPVNIKDKTIGWIFMHSEGVEKVNYWIFQRKVIFEIKYKPVNEGNDIGMDKEG